MWRPRTRLVPVALLAIGLLSPVLQAQTPEQLAETARYVQSLQNADGGFGATRAGESSLGSTSSAVRVLGFVGGSVPDIVKCRAYVESCYDPKTGGFALQPGGEAEVVPTAVGLMVAAELGLLKPEQVEKAVDYFTDHAESFEDARMSVAGLEAAGLKEIREPRWVEVLTAGRNDDGTWGEGASRAFETGGRAAALLRMGRELDHRDAIVEAIKGGQQSDGAWSKGDAPTDLPSTYRVMRALFMLKEKPDLDALRGYIARCRNEDGSYRTAPDRDDKGGTYYATIVLRWSRLLDGQPAIVETAGFRKLFDGRSLDGWEGDTSLWKVEDGMLVGDSPGIRQNEFLVAPGNYRDFILKFSFRLQGGQGNSGVQFRSVRVPGSSEMSGYQADIGEGYWGSLYDESRRNRTLVEASERAKQAVNADGWNHYVIRCMGDHITLYLDGVPSVDYREEDAEIARDGRIAVQVHAGGPMRIEFKDMYIQPLPTPIADDSLKPGFHARTVNVGGEVRTYSVYLPQGYDGSKEHPVILFLHGSGERGRDGLVPAQVGLGPNIAGHEDFPFIVVFPQARETWRADSDDAKAALAALDDVLETYKGDRDRVILTGLSMGGAGTWQLGSTEPDRFVALVPVCGFNDTSAARPIVEADLPVWSFIGDADSPRLLGSTRDLLHALREAGAEPRETEFRSVGHNSWDRAYSDPALIRWLSEKVKADGR